MSHLAHAQPLGLFMQAAKRLVQGTPSEMAYNEVLLLSDTILEQMHKDATHLGLVLFTARSSHALEIASTYSIALMRTAIIDRKFCGEMEVGIVTADSLLAVVAERDATGTEASVMQFRSTTHEARWQAIEAAQVKVGARFMVTPIEPHYNDGAGIVWRAVLLSVAAYNSACMHQMTLTH